ncbi:MAG TPA: T9SS type B sorting domain-containing protein, partial [Paludibacteraceae bacterium]|nr:T9SS type B sorting domain-containing protein [Paludibacteraceae bacterium]
TATLNLCERTCTQEIVRTVDTTGHVFAGTPADITYTCAGDVPVANTAAVTVTVANARGCETTVPFIVNRALDIIPALFFSPNNDGVNDTWEIENIGHYPHAIIEIYDRFSKLLITYKGNETGWDGMYLGYPMPMTDYWYIITIPELGKPRTGHFTLKR